MVRREGRVTMVAKRFFYVCAGVFLLALSYHLGAQVAGGSRGSPRIVEAERFVLRDASGRTRGMWSASGDDSVTFVLTDRKGRRAQLAIRGDSQALSLGPTWERSAFLVVAGDTPALVLRHGDGREWFFPEAENAGR
jgi:hypothetical protein